MTADPLSIFSESRWNRDAVRHYFDVRAERDEDYLAELKGKLARNRSCQSLYDMTLASFYVHEYLSSRIWLFSRHDFLGELANLETAEIPTEDYFDRQRFATFRLNLIHALIRASAPSE